eukprot:TRINITY_DN1423_c0_g1_i1.p1 TRINITY_DN1423_c0_g1~~TRINITY_DN1423_c0_g1_i1.p1  ORF type:complete len:179 (-),score=43.15 TRINITY_DN1423_c0_g1_i1:72-578(-)
MANDLEREHGKLVLAVLRSTRGGGSIPFALFSDGAYYVDSVKRGVWSDPKAEFLGNIQQDLDAAFSAKRYNFRIEYARTCQPIHYVYYQHGDTKKTIYVYGTPTTYGNNPLETDEEQNDGATQLPESICNIFAAVFAQQKAASSDSTAEDPATRSAFDDLFNSFPSGF